MQLITLKDFPDYAVSDEGDVWRITTPHAYNRKAPYKLKPNPTGTFYKGKTSYLCVTLFSYGKPKVKHSVHSLVCAAFHGPKPEGNIVLHWDGDGHNNKPENLRWGTYSENVADTIRHGRQEQGEQRFNAKLTNEDVLEIRRLDELLTPTKIAKLFKIDRKLVYNIHRRITWKHI